MLRIAMSLMRPLVIKPLMESSKRLQEYSSIANKFMYHEHILKPVSPLINQICGMKLKGTLRKRCKDCYFVVRQERLYVICPTHPRHKQMSMVKKPKNTWILTHASQSKECPW